MGKQPRSVTGRRTFLKSASAAGVVGLSALAGCSSNGEGTEESPTSNQPDANDNSETGGSLPTYTFLNNPPSYDPARHDAINLMAEQTRKLGLDVEVEVLEWGTLLDRVLSEQEFDFCSWNHSLKDEPGWRLRWMFHSDNLPKGKGNWEGYSNSTVDDLLDEQSRVSGEERISVLHDIQEHLARDCPHIPALHSADLTVYNKNQVSGWVDTPHDYNDFINMTTIEVSNGENELRGYWPEAITSLNVLGSHATSSKTIMQHNLLYDKLIRLDQNYEPSADLGLATDWSRPDEESVEYVIREGHKWHDGETVTAEDVAFTLRYLKEKGVGVRATQMDMVESVEQNGNTVRVNFNQTVGPVHSIFSNQIHIIPKHDWKDVDQPEGRNVTEPIGSGPLKFDYWDQGSELSLTRFDDHWRPTNFERRIWRIIPETSSVWELINRGDLNYMPKAKIGQQLVNNAENDQIGVASKPSDATVFVGPNLRRKGLDRVAVRQAVHNSIPKTAIQQQLFYGYGQKGWNIVPEMFGDYCNTDVMQFEEGVEPGKQRLRDAGFSWDDDGMLRLPAE